MFTLSTSRQRVRLDKSRRWNGKEKTPTCTRIYVISDSDGLLTK